MPIEKLRRLEDRSDSDLEGVELLVKVGWLD